VHVQNQAATTTEAPPRTRLICLASHRQELIQYRTWAQTLSDPIELVAVDIPLCADLGAPAPAQSPAMLARTLAQLLQPYLAGPHAVFGQGPGAHVALALTQLAQHAYPGQTRHLFVSSSDSPELAGSHSQLSIEVPITVLYPPGSLAAMLGWHSLGRRELELIELPASSDDTSLLNQRLVRIFNTHLGLFSF
jgi:hypothetical protein